MFFLHLDRSALHFDVPIIQGEIIFEKTKNASRTMIWLLSVVQVSFRVQNFSWLREYVPKPHQKHPNKVVKKTKSKRVSEWQRLTLSDRRSSPIRETKQSNNEKTIKMQNRNKMAPLVLWRLTAPFIQPSSQPPILSDWT